MLQFETEPRLGYLYALLTGEFTLPSAQAVYRGILQSAARYRQPRILLDATRITGHMSTSDRMDFGAFVADQHVLMLGQFTEPPQVGILAAGSIMDPSRFTQTVANNRGARLKSSESIQELLSWLGV